MAISADILDRKETHFVLWRPGTTAIRAPELVIGTLKTGNPPEFPDPKRFTMTPVAGLPGLWEIPARDCGLTNGQVYHYWFKVEDTSANTSPLPLVCCTDPMAFTVDWRLFPPGASDNRQPAAVILWQNDKLVPCDPGGEQVTFEDNIRPGQLPTNNQLVIYELPTAWVMSRELNEVYCDVGTFRDVRALVDEEIGGANFADLDLLDRGRSYLTELGVNAVELLPPR
jgi:pullulanase